MSKSNLRSFRFSDEVAGILEAQQGSSLNDKFENLVLRCFWEREQIEKQIAQQKKTLADLQERVNKKRDELYNFDSLFRDRQQLTKEFSRLGTVIADYTEKLKADSVTQNSAPISGQLEQKCVTSA